MTRRVVLRFDAVSGTQAGLGHTGGRTLIADRPEGVAGGQGLGFNGAELLAAALGGCFWNDLHHVAHAMGTPVAVVHVEAGVDLAGTPPRIVRATVAARLTGAPPATLAQVFDAARQSSTVANSLLPAFPVQFQNITGDPT
jgi:organic hydroperoxide reductase OsmC/OhrA